MNGAVPTWSFTVITPVTGGAVLFPEAELPESLEDPEPELEDPELLPLLELLEEPLLFALVSVPVDPDPVAPEEEPPDATLSPEPEEELALELEPVLSDEPEEELLPEEDPSLEALELEEPESVPPEEDEELLLPEAEEELPLEVDELEEPESLPPEEDEELLLEEDPLLDAPEEPLAFEPEPLLLEPEVDAGDELPEADG